MARGRGLAESTRSGCAFRARVTSRRPGAACAPLGGLTPAGFLSRYWQKRPLVIRRALPGFLDPLTPDELAGLACEPDVESRLVLERGGARPWQVVHGPQRAARLRRLPRTHWTLLVQEADRHVPALAELLERFAFVPRWRLDDVMVSFAPRHGTVGPHVDSYDVFLLQGTGRRRWSIDSQAREDYRPGLDLRVLRRFRPEREWVLERGDVLYVPPGVAHCGVSLEDAFTYSIGFRAPSHVEVVTAFLQRVVSGLDPSGRYADPDLRPPREPGEIAPRAIARLRGIVEAECRRVGGRAFARLVGEMLTQPKEPASRPRARRLLAAALRTRLRGGAGLVRGARSRIAFVRHGPGDVELFVDGRTRPLPPGLAFAGPLLSGPPRLAARDVLPHLRQAGFAALLAELVNAGAFELAARA
jgi:50S ribosomal protein L16 3-hydroxylase